MNKFEVVCNEKALSGFFEDYLSGMGKPEETYDNLLISLHWKKLLFKGSYLILDMTDDRYEELVKTDPMFLLLEKSCQGGGSRISASPGILDEYEKNESFGEFLSPMYIGVNFKKEHLMKFGRLIISQSEMNSIGSIIFNDSKYLISDREQKKDTLSSWNDMESVSLPFTDLILIDNYIVKTGGIGNVTSLLKALIPKNQEKSKIRLTIISAFFKETRSDIERKTNQWYSKLSQTLESKFPKLSFELSVAIITRLGLNHDRAVITNYLWIDSGHGFNCFNDNGKPKVTTTIKHIPIFSLSGIHKSSASSYDCWMTMRNHARKLIVSCSYKKGDFEKNMLLKE